MPLPACLTHFDVVSAEKAFQPKRVYDVIVSRPSRAVQITDTMFGAWTAVATHRCLLSRDGLEDRCRNGFLVCILREFDEIPE